MEFDYVLRFLNLDLFYFSNFRFERYASWRSLSFLNIVMIIVCHYWIWKISKKYWITQPKKENPNLKPNTEEFQLVQLVRILRKIIELEQQGAELFFGEKSI